MRIGHHCRFLHRFDQGVSQGLTNLNHTQGADNLPCQERRRPFFGRLMVSPTPRRFPSDVGGPPPGIYTVRMGRSVLAAGPAVLGSPAPADSITQVLVLLGTIALLLGILLIGVVLVIRTHRRRQDRPAPPARPEAEPTDPWREAGRRMH